jgi:hypothetical protein
MTTEKGLDICALSKRKLKGRDEFMMGRIKGVNG